MSDTRMASDEGAGAWRPTTTVLMGTLAKPGWDRHLQTLLDQTVAADEILVVIDRVVADDERNGLEPRWPQVGLQFSAARRGLTRSLNIGLGIARGEIVFRADDDDAYAPHRIERQLAELRRTGADFVSSWGEGVTGSETTPYLIRTPTDDAAIKQALLHRNAMLHPALAFRRAAVEQLGGYDESFVYAQDYALYLAAIRAGLRFANVPEPLVRRSYSDDSISVARRYKQLMFSAAARIVHCAHTGDRIGFVKTVGRYAALAATPRWARAARRRLFTMLGRGM